jgi:hypothetical protein
VQQRAFDIKQGFLSKLSDVARGIPLYYLRRDTDGTKDSSRTSHSGIPIFCADQAA